MDSIYFDGKNIPLVDAVILYDKGELDEDESIELLQEIVDRGLVNKSSRGVRSAIVNYIRFGLIDEKSTS
jgi:hypothetical protein